MDVNNSIIQLFWDIVYRYGMRINKDNDFLTIKVFIKYIYNIFYINFIKKNRMLQVVVNTQRKRRILIWKESVGLIRNEQYHE